MEAFLTSFLNSYQTHISGFHQNSVFAKPGIIGFCALDVLVVFIHVSIVLKLGTDEYQRQVWSLKT
jgi:hypothetical protein